MTPDDFDALAELTDEQYAAHKAAEWDLLDAEQRADHLSRPSRDFDPHDTAFCGDCAHEQPGVWEGDPTRPMTFRCRVCSTVTEVDA